MAKNKWMQEAFGHSRKGALHKRLGVSPKKRIPLGTLKSAAKRGVKGAALALTARKINARRYRRKLS